MRFKEYKEGGGIDPNYYTRLSEIESNNNSQARSKTSSASGKFQFIKSTWEGLTKKYGLPYNLEDRFNPEKSRKVAELYTQENANYLKSNLGITPNNTDLYAAHFMGVGGASKLLSTLKQNPNASAYEVATPGQINANKAIFLRKDGSVKTAKEVYETLNYKVTKTKNSTQNSEQEQNNPYRFIEYKKTDYYAPQIIENVSSLDNSQQNTNLAEDKATEIKNRLEQKKAEKALLQQMILATQVAYVNPADYQSQPTFEEPEQEQIFQSGGTVEVDNKWLQNWYQNRIIPNKDIQDAYLEDKPIYTERLKNIPPTTNVESIDNNPNITGRYEGDTGRLLITSKAQPSVHTHEVNHYLNDFPSTMRTVHENVVEQNMYKKDDPRLGVNNENYDYFRNPDEVHSRIQVLRKDAGFKPNEEVTQDKLLNYLKDYKGNDENILQLMNLTDEKGLLEMLNYMADNSESTKSSIMYAKNGGEKNSLWKNIRANRGSGKKPTKEMLEQERKIKRKEDGGVIPVSSLGMYEYPNQKVLVPTDGLITMKNISYNILGISQETGQQILMQPEQEYFFPNTQNVLEIPQTKSRIKTNRFSK